MELIDKTAVVAEIYKLRDFANDRWDIEEVNGIDKFLDKLIPYINSIEVKEVDLEKELELWMAVNEDNAGYFNTLEFAKHFFELGLKVHEHEQ